VIPRAVVAAAVKRGASLQGLGKVTVEVEMSKVFITLIELI